MYATGGNDGNAGAVRACLGLRAWSDALLTLRMGPGLLLSSP
jgi:hypothetical protein